MCNDVIIIEDKFEGDRIKSSIKFIQGKSNSSSEDGAMNYGFIINVSKEYLKDNRIIRYIGNLIKDENKDVHIFINETSIEFIITYANHVHVNTMSELNSCVQNNIVLAKSALNVFEMNGYEVISIFYFGNIPLDKDDILI